MINKSIGIFGGTFDPIHNGHLQHAQAIYQQFNLQTIYFVPCQTPVHKVKAMASAQQRCEMINLAIKDISHFKLDKREVERDTPSYMIETIKSFKTQFSEQTLFLIIGMDSLIDLPNWHNWRELFNYSHFIVLPRPGFSMPTLEKLDPLIQTNLIGDKIELEKAAVGKIILANLAKISITSTFIRQQLQTNRLLIDSCPKAVIDYIKEKKIYLTGRLG